MKERRQTNWTAAGLEWVRRHRQSAAHKLRQAEIEHRERERQREAALQRRLISEVSE